MEGLAQLTASLGTGLAHDQLGHGCASHCGVEAGLNTLAPIVCRCGCFGTTAPGARDCSRCLRAQARPLAPTKQVRAPFQRARLAFGARSVGPGTSVASKPNAFAAPVLSKEGEAGAFEGSTNICEGS